MPSVACRGPVTDLIRPQQKWKDEGHNDDLPNLHAVVESRERGQGRIRWQPDLLQRAGEAEAVNEPENERHPPQPPSTLREKKFSTATNMIVAAIAGSTMALGNTTICSAARDSVIE